MTPELVNVLQTVVTGILLGAVTAGLWYFRKYRIVQDARRYVLDAVLAAEKKYEDRQGAGAEKYEWVKDMVLRSPFAKYVDADLLEVWINSILAQYEMEK